MSLEMYAKIYVSHAHWLFERTEAVDFGPVCVLNSRVGHLGGEVFGRNKVKQ